MMASTVNSIRNLSFTASFLRLKPSSSSPVYQFPLLLHRTFQTRRLYCSRRNVVEILEERGLLDSLTSDALRRHKSQIRAYCGFDPTAESLHLGNLLGLIVLSWFLRCGHSVVALIGGATGLVGDPSGKSLERPVLDPISLNLNVAAISSAVRTILVRNHHTSDSDSDPFISIMNNHDWWKDVKLLDFLGDVGRFARVGTMISKETVRRRLESEAGISYAEFTYQLLQGYDFLHLFRNDDVNVQIGGSDQWGNITAGTDLIRKILNGEEKSGPYGLTFPLLLKSDGTKFGKSENGAVWLSPSLLSPYRFYQYFFTISDADVIRFLRILTFLPLDEISEIERRMGGEDSVPNTAQRRLAEEVTRFVHGEEGLKEAVKATEALMPGGGLNDWKAIEAIADDDVNVPCFALSRDEVLNLSVLELSVRSGLVESKSGGRRLIKQGGLYFNNVRVDNEGKRIGGDDIVDGRGMLLSAGKKKKMIVRVSESS